MGKGSNVQKKQAAQLKNQKDKGKTDEERKAASAKAKADAQAYICKICKQTFMVNVKLSLLYEHCQNKHPAASLTDCFDALREYDPADPDGKKKAAATKTATAIKPKKKKKEENLEDLLSAGLNVSKKKGGKK